MRAMVPGRTLALLAALAACRRAPTPRGPAPPVELVTRYLPGRALVEVVNRTPGDVTVELDARLTNLRSDPALPVTRVVAPHATLWLATLRPVDRAAPWRFTHDWRYALGSAYARHDDRAVYGLPFGPGERRRVLQGPHGAFTHRGADEDAVDFAMPVGALVLAAREGVVVAARERGDRGCPDPACADDANYLLVAHPDGSVAEYGHLRFGGLRVAPGAAVARGQAIAESGATGRVTEPHLHFVVRVVRSARRWESVPVRFATAQGVVAGPAAGDWLEAAGP